MASKLRRVFPAVWSNMRPNSPVCSHILLYACDLLIILHSLDSQFLDNCKITKSIVKTFKKGDLICVKVVRDYPSFPWNSIWSAAFNKILDNKLMDFQWRLSHHVLATGQRIARWGLGGGICPYVNCNVVETINHLFWECPRINPVIIWVKNVFKSLCDDNVDINLNLFLYGFTKEKISHVIFNRIWYTFCICKFIVWKSRCIAVFQGTLKSGAQMKSDVINEIKLRVMADHSRLSSTRFFNLWVEGNSFVKIKNQKLVFQL